MHICENRFCLRMALAMQRIVDRHARCATAATHAHLQHHPSKEFLQVELDIAPLASSRNGQTLGPSPLSVSSLNFLSARPTANLAAVSTSSLSAYASELQGCRSRYGLSRQKAEDALWLASAFFILFYGDFRSNFFSLLASDPRISRVPLFYGMGCLLINCMMMLLVLLAYPLLQRSRWKNYGEYFSAVISSTFILIGIAAFFMLSMALWPVWHVLTFPLLVFIIRAFKFSA
ncbi:hypothetical protein KP509_30G053100 [Ceratopteris richardii]|uniref:Uncharacterized protein n=1 Tax=Ceratopteris richardii TaxID=49495 RepID=A0A8T2R420_CERRI|nr:hypothetical protein KP509_30G053100 [Ceratopteris richardii]